MHSIISRINKTMKKNRLDFKNKYEEIIGCNKDKLREYIIKKLENGMNLDNYGIDWESLFLYIIRVVLHTGKLKN